MKGYLTKRPNGLFCLTRSYPVIARVGTTEDLDVFIPPGDGFGQHRIPHSCVSYVWSPDVAETLEPLRPAVAFLSPDKGRDVYLGRRGMPYGELCFISEYEPLRFEIGGWDDLGPRHDDPVYCNVFCVWFAMAVWGVVPDPCCYEKLRLSGRIRAI